MASYPDCGPHGQPQQPQEHQHQQQQLPASGVPSGTTNANITFCAQLRYPVTRFLPPPSFYDAMADFNREDLNVGYANTYTKRGGGAKPNCFRCFQPKANHSQPRWKKCKNPCGFCAQVHNEGELCNKVYATATWWSRYGNLSRTLIPDYVHIRPTESDIVILKQYGYIEATWKGSEAEIPSFTPKAWATRHEMRYSAQPDIDRPLHPDRPTTYDNKIKVSGGRMFVPPPQLPPSRQSSRPNPLSQQPQEQGPNLHSQQSIIQPEQRSSVHELQPPSPLLQTQQPAPPLQQATPLQQALSFSKVEQPNPFPLEPVRPSPFLQLQQPQPDLQQSEQHNTFLQRPQQPSSFVQPLDQQQSRHIHSGPEQYTPQQPQLVQSPKAVDTPRPFQSQQAGPHAPHDSDSAANQLASVMQQLVDAKKIISAKDDYISRLKGILWVHGVDYAILENNLAPPDVDKSEPNESGKRMATDWSADSGPRKRAS